MNRKQNAGDLLKQIPTKWAVAIVIALVAYTLLQPVANKRLGWGLPSLASLLGQEEQPKIDADVASARDNSAKADSKRSATPSDKQNGESNSQAEELQSEPEENTAVQEDRASRGKSPGENVAQPRGPPANNLRYGLLTEIGDEDYMSPGGLRYTKGSEEGHRLKHIERHLKDQPSRPSSHGVFYGDMPQVIRWLDDAYGRAKGGERGTKKEAQGRRTVYEASFDKPIGFVGGRTGAKKGNPDTRRVKIVVEGNRVITAYPF